jgi:hypothetical protein
MQKPSPSEVGNLTICILQHIPPDIIGQRREFDPPLSPAYPNRKAAARAGFPAAETIPGGKASP